MRTDKISETNDELKEKFRKIKLIYLFFVVEPFILFAVMFCMFVLFKQNIVYFSGIGKTSRSLVGNISLVFIILSVVEYYTIVVLMKRIKSIIGKVKSVEGYYSRYSSKFKILLSIALMPSIFGFFYYLISMDMIMSSLFYLVCFVSLLRVLPRYNIFRDLYIDLSEEET